MPIEKQIYQLKKGETLSTVAEQLGITVDELRKYHNTHCEPQDILWHHMHTVSTLCLPSSVELLQLKRKRLQHVQTNELPPQEAVYAFYAAAYLVTEQVTALDQEAITIGYHLAIQLRNHTQPGTYIAAIRREGFQKNNQPVDAKISSLAIACMESLWPLPLMITERGITGIADYENTIVAKFMAARPELEDFHMGTLAHTYIDNFQNGLLQERHVIQQFCSNLALQLLFPVRQWFYQTGTWEAMYYVHPHTFPVLCRLVTEYDYTDEKLVLIHVHGTIQDTASLQELLKGIRYENASAAPVTGNISIKYTIFKQTKMMYRAALDITLLHQGIVHSQQQLTITMKE